MQAAWKVAQRAVTARRLAHHVVSCAEMTQTELVAMLRSRARKSGTQTSHYRGVSLLKQTGKWHAQINVGGKQVHHLSALQNSAGTYTRHFMRDPPMMQPLSHGICSGFVIMCPFQTPWH